MKCYTFFQRKVRDHVAMYKMQTKHDRIRDRNIKIRILHKISKILVYNTSGHQIFHHILLSHGLSSDSLQNCLVAMIEKWRACVDKGQINETILIYLKPSIVHKL